MVEMSFEKIQPDLEHPAVKAARMIRQLHLETIALIDGGQVFLKDNVDVSAEMRAQCYEQVVLADKVMASAAKADPAAWKPQGFLLEDAEQTVNAKRQELEDAVAKATVPDDNASLPEIGNYEHKPE